MGSIIWVGYYGQKGPFLGMTLGQLMWVEYGLDLMGKRMAPHGSHQGHGLKHRLGLMCKISEPSRSHQGQLMWVEYDMGQMGMGSPGLTNEYGLDLMDKIWAPPGSHQSHLMWVEYGLGLMGKIWALHGSHQGQLLCVKYYMGLVLCW